MRSLTYMLCNILFLFKVTLLRTFKIPIIYSQCEFIHSYSGYTPPRAEVFLIHIYLHRCWLLHQWDSPLSTLIMKTFDTTSQSKHRLKYHSLVMREVEDHHIRSRATTKVEFNITSLCKISRQLVYTSSHSYVAQHPLFHPV